MSEIVAEIVGKTYEPTQDQINSLVEIGNEWAVGKMHRIYFENLYNWYGLKVNTYKSGNICSATLNGESISNTTANEILSDLIMPKIWFDMVDCKFHGKNIQRHYFAPIVKGIKLAAKIG
jgi:hypothetical protein